MGSITSALCEVLLNLTDSSKVSPATLKLSEAMLRQSDEGILHQKKFQAAMFFAAHCFFRGPLSTLRAAPARKKKVTGITAQTVPTPVAFRR
jgi:hypothetical protein